MKVIILGILIILNTACSTTDEVSNDGYVEVCLSLKVGDHHKVTSKIKPKKGG